MSDLYLDEEMTVGAYLYVAKRLASSGFSVDELEEIFFNEVHPVCCWNFTVPAGEWGLFDREWLKEKISLEMRRDRPRTWRERMWTKQREKEMKKLKELVRCDWEKVKLLVTVIRERGLREIASE